MCVFKSLIIELFHRGSQEAPRSKGLVGKVSRNRKPGKQNSCDYQLLMISYSCSHTVRVTSAFKMTKHRMNILVTLSPIGKHIGRSRLVKQGYYWMHANQFPPLIGKVYSIFSQPLARLVEFRSDRSNTLTTHYVFNIFRGRHISTRPILLSHHILSDQIQPPLSDRYLFYLVIFSFLWLKYACTRSYTRPCWHCIGHSSGLDSPWNCSRCQRMLHLPFYNLDIAESDQYRKMAKLISIPVRQLNYSPRRSRSSRILRRLLLPRFQRRLSRCSRCTSCRDLASKQTKCRGLFHPGQRDSRPAFSVG